MNCRTAIVRALARRDAPLPALQATELQAHLEACPGCARRTREMEMALGWVGELPIAEPSANFEWRLRLRLSKLEQESNAPPRPWAVPARWRVQFLGSAAAAAVVVLSVGLILAPRLAPHHGASPSTPRLAVAPRAAERVPLPGLAGYRDARLDLTGGRGMIGPQPPPSPQILIPSTATDSDSVAPAPEPARR